MKTKSAPPSVSKCPTGISGLDALTYGGLPRGRTTMVWGESGAGKTVLALQSLVHGATVHEEPGIFVAFEENSRRLIANAATFGWDLPALTRQKLFFLDAETGADQVAAGEFDLQGLLAVIGLKVREMKATRIVFDAIDVLLEQLDDPAARRRELARLHSWLLEHNLTAIITTKKNRDPGVVSTQLATALHYLVDCAIDLSQTVSLSVAHRDIRVMKYRGARFAENEFPFVITDSGIEVAAQRLGADAVEASAERVSTGIERLDTMLSGGYHRHASVLITGSPGTAKTTLAGAFAVAACRRGEKVLFTTFDSEPAEIVRNLASVNLDLASARRRGLLHFHTSRSGSHNAEVHLINIKAAARAHDIRCLVVDPISALAKLGHEFAAHSVLERLIDWAKSAGITVVCTSLLNRQEPEAEGTSLQISTIADTWIHLSYVINAGERNRALSIVKSRGTAHSNQVRELILHDDGISLAEVYTAGGQVLMGTLRWEKERALRRERDAEATETTRQKLELDLAQSDLQSRITRLQHELELKKTELQRLAHSEKDRLSTDAQKDESLRSLRRSDAPDAARPAPRKKSAPRSRRPKASR